MGYPSWPALWIAAQIVLAMPPAWGLAVCTIALVLAVAPTRRPALPSTLPATGDPTMAYLNRTIKLTFDGVSTLDGVFADDDGKPTVLPYLGDDLWVIVRNPMLMPQSLLTTKRDVAMNSDGTPVSRDEAMQAGSEVVAGLIVDWNLTDVLDLAEHSPVLGIPTNADVLRHHVPSVVSEVIAQMLGRARNPR